MSYWVVYVLEFNVNNIREARVSLICISQSQIQTVNFAHTVQELIWASNYEATSTLQIVAF